MPAGPLGVAAGEHPVAHPLGDERGLQVDVRHRPRGRPAPRRARARARRPRARLRSRAAAAAARAPQWKISARSSVARRGRSLRERERLVEERDARWRCSKAGSGRRPAGRAGRRGRCPRTRGARSAGGALFVDGDTTADVATPGRAPRPRPESARTSSSTAPGREQRPSGDCRTPRSPRRSVRAFVSASARASIASTRLRSSAETPCSRKPASTPSLPASHSIVSRVGAGLAALDLADVLLRETVAGEIGLRQPRRHAQLAQRARRGGRYRAGPAGRSWRVADMREDIRPAGRSETAYLTHAQVSAPEYPPKGHKRAANGVNWRICKIT